MYTFQIKTHQKGSHTAQPHFFILSRGNNTGKPMNAPCPNCFRIIVETEEAKNFYFWLAYGLWQSRAFERNLRGSVIPFIIIREAKKIMEEAAEKAQRNRIKYLKSIALLQDVDKKASLLQKQLGLIKEVKRAIMFLVLDA